MDLIGNYTQKADPISRISTIDVCELGLKSTLCKH